LYLQVLVDLVSQISEKFKRVLLFPDVDLLTPQLESLPECVRFVELQPRVVQVREDVLQLVENSFVRFPLVFDFFAQNRLKTSEARDFVEKLKKS